MHNCNLSTAVHLFYEQLSKTKSSGYNEMQRRLRFLNISWLFPDYFLTILILDHFLTISHLFLTRLDHFLTILDIFRTIIRPFTDHLKPFTDHFRPFPDQLKPFPDNILKCQSDVMGLDDRCTWLLEQRLAVLISTLEIRSDPNHHCKLSQKKPSPFVEMSKKGPVFIKNLDFARPPHATPRTKSPKIKFFDDFPLIKSWLLKSSQLRHVTSISRWTTTSTLLSNSSPYSG